MTSFKRRAPASTPSLPSGCRLSHYNALPLTSTGLASLDDILAGGVPLGSTILITEDGHDGGYSKLVLRYWIAQGLASGQEVVLVGNSDDHGGAPEDVNRKLMGVVEDLTPSFDNEKRGVKGSESEDDREEKEGNASMKIAWRYEATGKHSADVPASAVQHQGPYCHVFDLSKSLTLTEPIRSRLHFLNLANPNFRRGNGNETFASTISEMLKQAQASKPPRALRVAFQNLGSPSSPFLRESQLFNLITSLNHILRSPSTDASNLMPSPSSRALGAAMITLETAAHTPSTLRKLQYAVNGGCLGLRGFDGDPALQAAFPNHHGIASLARLPSPSSLSPPSTKLSSLLSSSLSSASGSNLGFKVGRRKGMKFELMGLGIEGGVNERITEPVPQSRGASGVEPNPGSRARARTADGIADANNVDNNGRAPQEVATEKPRRGGLKKTALPRHSVRFGNGKSEETEHSVKNLSNIDW